MKLENELFLCNDRVDLGMLSKKQKDSDNEKNVTLSKAYKGGKFGLLQVVRNSGEVEYRKSSHIDMMTLSTWGMAYSVCFKITNI